VGVTKLSNGYSRCRYQYTDIAGSSVRSLASAQT